METRVTGYFGVMTPPEPEKLYEYVQKHFPNYQVTTDYGPGNFIPFKMFIHVLK